MAASAVCGVLLARLAWDSPRLLAPVLAVCAILALPAILARRRMHKLLRSGDVQRILVAWAPSFERLVYPETMTPLLVATAYASCGFSEAARRALDRAARGPAWDAAVEQRLVVEALLDTFEGARAEAVEKGEALLELPLPPGARLTRRKITVLRKGVLALARAFAHVARADDEVALRRAGRSSPIVFWPMRYAEAIVNIDRGDRARASSLLEGAPDWPKESVFRAYHDELALHSRR